VGAVRLQQRQRRQDRRENAVPVGLAGNRGLRFCSTATSAAAVAIVLEPEVVVGGLSLLGPVRAALAAAGAAVNISGAPAEATALRAPVVPGGVYEIALLHQQGIL